jgi:hypothetical protein
VSLSATTRFSLARAGNFVLFAVTSFGRTQFASAYGLILRASHSKSIGFGAKVHAASVQRRLDTSSASIRLFISGLLISTESMTLCSPCPCIQTGCPVEFEERRLCWANLVVPRNSCTDFGATVGRQPRRHRSHTHPFHHDGALGRFVYAAWWYVSEMKPLRIRFALRLLIA